ncbi:hypothetical protein BDZ97DRAFT_1756760 [Flammula alnicola]|nr:hypothetical protein BDZ97DRAFT_1756760 [Flammula alnicola]
MYFNTKFASLLLAVAASTFSVQAAVIARIRFHLSPSCCCIQLIITYNTHQNELAELSVIFFDDIDLTGASYSPDTLVQSVCTTLPGDWLDRPESVLISPGFACTFFEFQGCEGPGTVLSGTVDTLQPSLYDNTESFTCNKQI